MNEKKSNVWSILSLFFGIIGLLLSCLAIGMILCIPALILGIVALAKKQSEVMAVGGIICSAIGTLIACAVLFDVLSGGNNKTESTSAPIFSLVGNWETQDKGDTYQAGYITSDTIEIFWITDGNASLYWSGSFVEPSELTDGYSWDSVNNKNKTDVDLLTSGDTTKTFTYSDGMITYEASALGMTQTITLVPSDIDYSVFCTSDSKSDVENNNSESLPIDVYYVKLANDYSAYTDKRIRTIVPISEYFNDSTIRVTEGIEYAMYIETDTAVLHDVNYATIVGTVTPSGYYVHLTDCEIEYLWDEAPDKYLEAKTQYDEEQLAIAVFNRERFVESTETVTYNDLRRYPDSYKDKPIQLTITFTDVEPDGFIFQGDMFAKMSGSNDELAIYDGREVREPRFMESDTITVYATGNGLVTVKVKDGTGLFANVIDEYEIPSIKVLYTDMDNLESVPTKDVNSKYEKGREVGKQAAKALNEWLEQ